VREQCGAGDVAKRSTVSLTFLNNQFEARVEVKVCRFAQKNMDVCVTVQSFRISQKNRFRATALLTNGFTDAHRISNIRCSAFRKTSADGTCARVAAEKKHHNALLANF